MATISKGIKLYKGDVELTNLQEIPELGGSAEAIEITTLADAAHVYTDGILNYGDSLAFKFLYEKTQFTTLNEATGSQEWKVELPDGATCEFSGTCSVKLDGVGVNAALTYTLSVKPDSEMVWA
ncbi:MAG: phage tail protein [Clostridia bacterium]|nr:phage tail protein [Clostridia bacterium]